MNQQKLLLERYAALDLDFIQQIVCHNIYSSEMNLFRCIVQAEKRRGEAEEEEEQNEEIVNKRENKTQKNGWDFLVCVCVCVLFIKNEENLLSKKHYNDLCML